MTGAGAGRTQVGSRLFSALGVIVVVFTISLMASSGVGMIHGAVGEDTSQVWGFGFEELRHGGGLELDEGGTLILWTSDGSVEKDLSGDELREHLEALVGGQSLPLHHGEGPYIGIGNARLATHTQWRACDYASMWIIHMGSPGERILTAEEAPVHVPTTPICGGFYGPSSTWSRVEIDLTPAHSAPGCAAAMILLPHPVQPATPYGGWACTGTAGVAAGNGIIASFIVQPSDQVLDIFIGESATLVIE